MPTSILPMQRAIIDKKQYLNTQCQQILSAIRTFVSMNCREGRSSPTVPA
jgi:hypothetical protein